MLDITTISRQSLGKVVSYYADGADDYYAKTAAPCNGKVPAPRHWACPGR
jgi:hypothetical protein